MTSGGSAGWRHRVPLKVREIIKLIEADGWYLVVTVGSHRQFKHPLKAWAGDNSW